MFENCIQLHFVKWWTLLRFLHEANYWTNSLLYLTHHKWEFNIFFMAFKAFLPTFLFQILMFSFHINPIHFVLLNLTYLVVLSLNSSLSYYYYSWLDFIVYELDLIIHETDILSGSCIVLSRLLDLTIPHMWTLWVYVNWDRELPSKRASWCPELPIWPLAICLTYIHLMGSNRVAGRRPESYLDFKLVIPNV